MDNRRPGPYIALDCGLFRNQKLESLSAKAQLLYIASLCHAGDELTDGHVSTAACRRLLHYVRASSKHVGELRAAKLWKGDGPWEINDYLEWNSSRESVLGKRAAGARRVAEHRERKRQEAPSSNGRSNALRNAPIEVEVEQKQVLDLPTSTPDVPDLAAETGVTVQDMTPVSEHAARLLERLRAQT